MNERKSLVFCTAFANSADIWVTRYRRWIDAIKDSNLVYDQIILIDDGSPILPAWDDVLIVNIEDDRIPSVSLEAKIILLHFTNNLGRRSASDFPGWYRSFCFAGKYAQKNNFYKLMHIESDSFLISKAIQIYFNQSDEGWIALWCRRWTWPETALQIISGKSINSLANQDVAVPADELIGKWMELSLPFTHVEKNFNGDRYGEYLSYVPKSADFAVQTISNADSKYFWWLDQRDSRRSEIATPGLDIRGGIIDLTINEIKLKGDFSDTLVAISEALSCQSFFETSQGSDAIHEKLKCDVLALIDLPRDRVREVPINSTIGRRLITQRYLTASAEFFAKNNLKQILPNGKIDLALLNGRHLFEIVLQEFIEIEKLCDERSVIIIGSCLPLNARMAERDFRVDENEDNATKYYWTGDVWKFVELIGKYRPDIEITILNCAPAGALLCRNLNANSTFLASNRDQIVEEFLMSEYESKKFSNTISHMRCIDVEWLLEDLSKIDTLFGRALEV